MKPFLLCLVLLPGATVIALAVFYAYQITSQAIGLPPLLLLLTLNPFHMIGGNKAST